MDSKVTFNTYFLQFYETNVIELKTIACLSVLVGFPVSQMPKAIVSFSSLWTLDTQKWHIITTYCFSTMAPILWNGLTVILWTLVLIY